MAKGKLEIQRPYTYEDIERRVFDIMPFSGEWLRHLGEVERSGSILIMGDSGHGKTTYAMQMMKAICEFEKVFYNSSEEGMKASFRRNLDLNGLKAKSSQYVFQKERYDDMIRRLNRKRQPKVVFIDSIQYCFRGKKKDDYHNMIEMFPKTLFVGVSHYKNGKVIGAVADEFYWDCQDRIFVQDFKAYLDKSRTGGDELNPYIISKEKAEERELKLLKRG